MIAQQTTTLPLAKTLNMQIEKFSYDNKIVRNFAYATVIWAIVGMLVGLWVAFLMV
ncbi:MAG: cytochrome-c oxidase, cbb3-type subunit, partial [Bacteroidota bacterium]